MIEKHPDPFFAKVSLLSKSHLKPVLKAEARDVLMNHNTPVLTVEKACVKGLSHCTAKSVYFTS